MLPPQLCTLWIIPVTTINRLPLQIWLKKKFFFKKKPTPSKTDFKSNLKICIKTNNSPSQQFHHTLFFFRRIHAVPTVQTGKFPSQFRRFILFLLSRRTLAIPLTLSKQRPDNGCQNIFKLQTFQNVPRSPVTHLIRKMVLKIIFWEYFGKTEKK